MRAEKRSAATLTHKNGGIPTPPPRDTFRRPRNIDRPAVERAARKSFRTKLSLLASRAKLHIN